ncbi:hypothetical protein MMC07_009316 [Pseudocyphellaria aurata]|nr:hypothetical protein [Pseudocyphellaria aurata]
MASKPSSVRPPNTSTTSSVRRNLFHQHLSRRPTSTSTSTSATTLQDLPQDDCSEIAIRDLNGDYQVHIPRLPPTDDDQPQEDEVTENEKNEAKLLEMRKNKNIQPSELTELMSAAQSSLRRTVASLDEDNWIFEANSWDVASEPSPQTYVNQRS